MSPECWTTHYSSRRLPADALVLKAPLQRAWKHKPRGVAVGAVWAGDGDVFVSIGKEASAKRMALRSGKVVWQDTGGGVALMARWRSHLLVSGSGEVRELDFRTGDVRRVRQGRLGLQDCFIVDDLLVGALAESWHAIDLETLVPVWSKPDFTPRPLIGDGRVVIRAYKDTTCVDLKTGTSQWERAKSDIGECFHVPCIWQDRFCGFYSQGNEGALMALDVKTGKTVWRWVVPTAVLGWFPYAGRAYCLLHRGRYVVLDLVSGQVVFEKDLGAHVPVPMKGKKSGLMIGVRGERSERWENTQVIVSETHAFLANASGQIVALKRDTGEVEQVVEIDGMPASVPIIYENRLLITDMTPATYCFEGTS
jgi:outer membrane protein assembly factor BamB